MAFYWDLEFANFKIATNKCKHTDNKVGEIERVVRSKPGSVRLDRNLDPPVLGFDPFYTCPRLNTLR